MQINKLLLLLNSIFLVKSLNQNNDEKTSEINEDLTSFDNTLKHMLDYEQIVFRIEEKLKSMTEVFDQLEIKMTTLVHNNMNVLDKHIQKVMEETTQEKIKLIDKTIEDKTNQIRLENESLKVMNKNIEDKLENIEKLMDKIKGSNQMTEDKVRNMEKILEDEFSLKLQCFNDSIPKTCHNFKGCNNSNNKNIYSIMVPEVSNKSFPAVCDLKTLGGGWTIIQRRQDGSENFYRNWTEYAEGFGDLNGEFFMGLNKIHALTSLKDPQELYVILENFKGVKKYARYGIFKVDSESNDFKLTVGEYSGDAGDSLKYHNYARFSTRDHYYFGRKCAENYEAAWWYYSCMDSNLNGQYYRGENITKSGGIVWITFGGYYSSLKFTQMMIRPKNQ